MKHILQSLAAALTLLAWCQPADACTNLLVGKNASADGSTIITYAADSHTLFGDLQYLPAADHKPGDMRQIHDWDTGKYLGAIPEVAHTYAVVGNMNEHQLTIGESTLAVAKNLSTPRRRLSSTMAASSTSRCNVPARRARPST
jgi:dipeptidase